MILNIYGIPPVSFPVLDAGTARTSVDGEVPSISVRLDNARGEAAGLLAVPPLRARAALVDGDAIVFSGRVQSVSLSAVATIHLEQ
ncbi:MAG: hypothetical protein LBP58_01395 [Azoarcus sp.]|jgi:hypothetical protein|nr:hypothetical protein [Azoarcus sp.]